MKERDTGLYLEDILRALEKISSFVSGMSLAEFREDERT